MKNNVYLLGGGGHGLVVLDTLLSCGIVVHGVFDSKLKLGEQIFGVPVRDEDKCLNELSSSEIFIINGLGANPKIANRQRIYITMKNRGLSFMSFHHPSAIVGKECILAEGSQLMAGTILQSRVIVGENSVINTGARVDHGCVISAHVFISPGSILCGDVIVGESVFIGAGAVIMPGIQIGEGAIVGAGAVVTKDVPSGWIVAKNPAVKIGMNL